MGPDTPTPKESAGKKFVTVALGETLIGHQVSKKGESLDVTSVFGWPELRSEGPQYSLFYFRTKDGNVYQLSKLDEDNGLLVSSRQSRGAGGRVGKKFWDYHIHPTLGLQVGQLFTYDSGGTKYTPVVTEAVGVLKDLPKPGEIERLTEGRTSSIIDDFGRDLVDGPLVQVST